MQQSMETFNSRFLINGNVEYKKYNVLQSKLLLPCQRRSILIRASRNYLLAYHVSRPACNCKWQWLHRNLDNNGLLVLSVVLQNLNFVVTVSKKQVLNQQADHA